MTLSLSVSLLSLLTGIDVSNDDQTNVNLFLSHDYVILYDTIL
jgi:hypothetical protein